METNIIKILKEKSERFPLYEGEGVTALEEGNFKEVAIEVKDVLLKSIDIDNFWYNAMHFKSDANPFSEDGELQVNDGYGFIQKSVTEYLKNILEQKPVDILE